MQGAAPWPDRACAPAPPFDAAVHGASRPAPRIVAKWRLLAPAFAVIAAALLSSLTRFDLRLADALYAWQGGTWSLRTSFLTQQVLHVAARDASVAAWIAVVIALASACSDARWRAWRRPLACLALSVLLSTLLVAWVKSWSNVDCPWDLTRYGGQHAYVDLFAARSAASSTGRCFPAGHASAGYAWMAAYFLLLSARPAWRRHGLAAGIALGLAFGFAQQLRGAHFLSHDLWSAALCWLVAVAVHAVARQPLQPHGDVDRSKAAMAAAP